MDFNLRKNGAALNSPRNDPFQLTSPQPLTSHATQRDVP